MDKETLFYRLTSQLESLGALYREVSNELRDWQDLKLRELQSETRKHLVEAFGIVRIEEIPLHVQKKLRIEDL